MLTKRANILFDEDAWDSLRRLASVRGVSVGELVRRAVRKTYRQETKREKISRACQTILNLRKKHSGLDYKKLIDYGRKY